MGDYAPVVFDGDGNPMRVRLVDADSIGEVGGEEFYGYEWVGEADRSSPTVYFDPADVDGLLTAADVLGMVEARVERLEGSLDRAENQYVNPDCPECGREMETGSLGGGTITYGCYPPIGDREGYDCPFYQEHGYAYSIERTLRDVAPIRRELQSMEHLSLDIRRRMEDDDG